MPQVQVVDLQAVLPQVQQVQREAPVILPKRVVAVAVVVPTMPEPEEQVAQVDSQAVVAGVVVAGPTPVVQVAQALLVVW
jgi:uncharacterized membrane protein